jgi:6,7-dimethyl-8-ribityllumazine synthase
VTAGDQGAGAPAGLSGAGLRIGVVRARWNSHIVDRLAEGVGRGLAGLDVDPAAVVDVTVPGSFELPMGARVLASSGRVDAVICLGCVIRGETTHYELVAGESAAGIPFAVGIHGETPGPGEDGAAIVRPWAEAGATWWLESIHGWRGSTEELFARVAAGPPRG